jgi:hypothetical protein
MLQATFIASYPSSALHRPGVRAVPCIVQAVAYRTTQFTSVCTAAPPPSTDAVSSRFVSVPNKHEDLVEMKVLL